MNGFVQFLKSLGPTRLAAMGAVTALLIGFMAFIIMRVSTPAMAPLFTDLTLEDQSGVVKELERQGIKYELRRDGSTVMVPKDMVPRLRMKLAESGLPKGGGVGYEIFDKSDALGATSFVQNINHLRALEGELARSIRGIERVEAARVHLVLPERPLFSRDRVEPSASIVVRVRGGLEAAQIRAVRHLVASAVQGLKPERISLVDESGRLLASGTGDANGEATVQERQLNHERRLKDQVEALVGSVVGQGRARVNVTAEMDFNRITQTSENFDPESKVVRSSQTREEQSSSAEASKDGQVSVGNELPNARGGAGGGNAETREQNKKSEEVVNYEISRTTRQEVIEGGRIKRVSIAVLVDGAYGKNANGDVTYQARPQEELDRLAALVRSSIGFDAKRGDTVEVVNLRFAEQPASIIKEPEGWMAYLQFTKDDIFRAAEIGVMLILSLLVLLFVVRPLMRKAFNPEPYGADDGEGGYVSHGGGQQAIGHAGGGQGGSEGELPAIGAPSIAGENAAPPVVFESAASKMIDMAQVQGQVQAQSIQKVAELVEKNPHETTHIIRQWLQDT